MNAALITGLIDPGRIAVSGSDIFVTNSNYIPEPSTFALAILGALSLGFIRRRKRP